MKLLHLADLHIGKRVNEFNMLSDQAYILDQILQIAVEEEPNGILVAGDVYDKSQPSAEAVELLDEFLTKLTALGQPVFMISGNHDSPERLSFGSQILQKNGLYIAGTFDGSLKKISLEDEYGMVNIYLLPFLKPAKVNPFFEQTLESYDEAVRAVISAADIHEQERNILVTHHFVVDGSRQPERSDSENVSVGGVDNVDVSAFEVFDYVALGHLHRAQNIGQDNVRYAGSPLKYSFSEARHQKSATLLELGKKEELSIRQIPLIPLHDLREIKGPIDELLRVGRENPDNAEDYMHVTLTDEEEIYDAIGQLRQVYPNLMVLDFENSRTAQAVAAQLAVSGDIAKKSPMDLFADFYQMQNNNELTLEQVQVLERIFEEAGGAGV
ncbi:exonuclease SbcCD subunit D [Clostridium sp. C105KSO13]|uniref:exonuclease SbcCD subunit D n=1 Tax=Clostridium sp. C105KSO13 TaxID=1776045 RepID=UPI000740872D|nr:exonuclease SbcCD subunit D [Clostridium sp. C105KSO13]CUX27292.1 Nuclease SbcCD subunit D [Clostridium sp. C105KSO13]